MSNRTGGADDRNAADKARDKAAGAKDQVQNKAASAAAEVRDTGEHLVEEGKQKARELGDRAEEMARSRADEQKDRVTEGMRSVAEALRKGGQELPADRSQYRPLLTNVAARVESVSGYLESRDVDMLTRDVRRFARDHTPLFLGGAFTLGLLGARFLKSSADEAHRNQFGAYPDYPGSQGYGTDRYDRMLPESGVGTGSQGYRGGAYSAGRTGTMGMGDGATPSAGQSRGAGQTYGASGASSTGPGAAGAGLTNAASSPGTSGTPGTPRTSGTSGTSASSKASGQRETERDSRGGRNA